MQAAITLSWLQFCQQQKFDADAFFLPVIHIISHSLDFGGSTTPRVSWIFPHLFVKLLILNWRASPTSRGAWPVANFVSSPERENSRTTSATAFVILLHTAHHLHTHTRKGEQGRRGRLLLQLVCVCGSSHYFFEKKETRWEKFGFRKE